MAFSIFSPVAYVISVATTLCCSSTCSHKVVHHETLVGDGVTLDCPGEVMLENRWKFNDDLLYTARFANNIQLTENINLLTNYSLRINSVALDQEGVYECFWNFSSLARHVLTIKVYEED